MLSTKCTLSLSMLWGTKQWKGHENIKVRLENEFSSFHSIHIVRHWHLLPPQLWWDFDVVLCDSLTVRWGKRARGAGVAVGWGQNWWETPQALSKSSWEEWKDVFSECSSSSLPRGLDFNLTHISTSVWGDSDILKDVQENPTYVRWWNSGGFYVWLNIK